MKLSIVFIFINHLYFSRFSLASTITSRRLTMGGRAREKENKMRFWNVIREIGKESPGEGIVTKSQTF